MKEVLCILETIVIKDGKFAKENYTNLHLSSHFSTQLTAQAPLPCHIFTIYYSLSNSGCLQPSAFGLHFL